MRLCLLVSMFLFVCSLTAKQPAISLGVDVFFQSDIRHTLKGKRIALVTNQTGVDKQMRSTIDLFLSNTDGLKLVALFSPEHGINGQGYAFEDMKEKKGPLGIPIYSLHGKTRRPTAEMLKGIDVIVYDIQDIGCRSYTFTTTLFYVMEEAAKKKIPVIVFDRPNPVNGLIVDGPMLQEKWRSYIGYIDVPYCHGMTIGELAQYFNETYKINCQLQVVAMQGWQRWMTYKDTGLSWVPTSPYIPEPDTPLFYATTGILGELSLVNIGIGYTLPFKLIGAPWIDGVRFAKLLNQQALPGVTFLPFHYRPFYGLYKGKECQGVMMAITRPTLFKPVTTQYMILGILKILYPKQVLEHLNALEQTKKNLFCKANGNEEMLRFIFEEKYIAWKLIQYQKEERAAFLKKREAYLLY